ncbi:PQQ-dependent sugar dehydrogenase [Pseudoalteromonas rubra]|uniref:Glucose/Sorbosone dehydrogenase domain-containing protein n=1 Tax=Pseudoalteromonas rubra TaxID=43658 RepID=A0A0U3HL04_9GAMM|nr:PQQ-dependent sugar dehydrogenase [Pseudoalteromonas rubra]ALU41576.1 hypothetical protein AT705_00760 [Pseudoalteromonas rubra]
MKKILNKIALSLLFISAQSVQAVEPQTIELTKSADNYQLDLVARGIQIPWGMVWLNDKELLVTDRSGQLRLIKQGKLQAKP